MLRSLPVQYNEYTAKHKTFKLSAILPEIVRLHTDFPDMG